jgi:hypothetical protein
MITSRYIVIVRKVNSKCIDQNKLHIRSAHIHTIAGTITHAAMQKKPGSPADTGDTILVASIPEVAGAATVAMAAQSGAARGVARRDTCCWMYFRNLQSTAT